MEKGKRKSRKSTKVEVDIRVGEVLELVTQRASGREIAEYCRDKWGIQRAQSEVYIAKARERMEKVLQKRMKTVLSECISELDYIAQACVGGPEPQWGVSRQCVMDKAKLLGLDKNRHVIEDERPYEDEDDEAILEAAKG